ncbi:MAG: thioredoxin-dependent thiol peroxidase, partial [Candidatus Micrarchaeota archaeon]
MVELKEGDMAPQFSLPDKDGKVHALSMHLQKTVVLYFYPKDDTPGCTTEACGFRDLNLEIKKAGAQIIGISPDNGQSHEKFSKKFSLNFPILSDAGHEVAGKYGAWGKKKFMGKEFEGIIRSTFIIKGGKIAKAYYGVKTEGHAKKILEDLANI